MAFGVIWPSVSLATERPTHLGEGNHFRRMPEYQLLTTHHARDTISRVHVHVFATKRETVMGRVFGSLARTNWLMEKPRKGAGVIVEIARHEREE